MLATQVALLAATAVLSSVLTGLMRRYALSRALLDVPNERSSHTRPVPRGGGLAIAGALFLGVLVARVFGWIDTHLVLATCGGGLVVAYIGWLDDRRGVSPLVRALVHFGAAVWALAWIGGLPELRLGSVILSLGPTGHLLAAVAIVWLLNLYNFMDGIDGIAAGEAVTAGAAAGLALLAARQDGLALLAFLVVAASAGFLPWNWSPARIFMGDVSSGLLGYLFGVLMIASERRGGVSALLWVVLLGVFVVDATVTLLRRLFRGERWYMAHRSHAYQRLVQAGWPHARVSLAVMAVNVLLALLVAAATRDPAREPGVFLVAMALLLTLYLCVERYLPMQHPVARHS